MSLRYPLTWSLLNVFLCAIVLSGCLGESEDPEASGDLATDDDAESTGQEDDAEGDEGNDEGDDGSDPEGEDPQDDGAQEECSVSLESLTSWSHDGLAVPAPDQADPTGDPLLLLAQVSNESFDVPDGTEALIVSASAGDHITLGWQVTLIDPSGSPAYTFSGELGPGIEGVTGEAIEENDTVTAPPAGTWTLQAAVTGYVEGLQVQIDANVCA